MFVASISKENMDLALSLNKVIFENMNALAEDVDFTSLGKEYLRKLPVIETLTNEKHRVSYQALSNLFQSMKLNIQGFSFQFVVKNASQLQSILPTFETRTRIVIDLSFLEPNNLQCTGQSISMLINQYTGNMYVREITQISVDFITDPFKFKPKLYQLVSEIRDSRLAKPPQHSIQSSSWSNDATTFESKTSFQPKPVIPTDLLDHCEFRGVSENPLRILNLENESSHDRCDNLFQGKLDLFALNENSFVYIDSLMKDDPQILGQLPKLCEIHNFVDAFSISLVEKISTFSGISKKNIPLILVIISEKVLGYTDLQGGIFINIFPLIKVSTVDEIKLSVFLTILHELVHRIIESPRITIPILLII